MNVQPWHQWCPRCTHNTRDGRWYMYNIRIILTQKLLYMYM